MNLPRGRLLRVYWRWRWHLGAVPCAGAYVLWLGPLLVVLFTARMTWDAPAGDSPGPQDASRGSR